MKKKSLQLIGTLLTIIALFMIGKQLFEMNIDYMHILQNNPFLLFICITIYCILFYLMGLPWSSLVHSITEYKTNYIHSLAIYSKANLMKYIPGNIFQYVGRGEIGVRYGLKQSQVLLASGIDMGINAAAVCIIACIFYAKGVFLWFGQYFSTTQIFLLLSFLILFSIIILWIALKKVAFLSFLLKKATLVRIAYSLVYYMAFHLTSALLFILVFTYILGQTISPSQLPLVIGSWCIAWFIGYVTPGAPGGMGIRELVLYFLLKGILPENEILLATVILRVCNIIGEVTAYLFGVCINSITSYKNNS